MTVRSYDGEVNEWSFIGRGEVVVEMPWAPLGAVRFMEVQIRIGRLALRAPCPLGWEVSTAAKPVTGTCPMPDAAIFRKPVCDEDDRPVLIEGDGAEIFVRTWTEAARVPPSPAEWASARAELLGIVVRL